MKVHPQDSKAMKVKGHSSKVTKLKWYSVTMGSIIVKLC